MMPDGKDIHLIAEYTAGLFEAYERLKAGDSSVPFWDLVVLCCSNDAPLEAAFNRYVSALRLPAAAQYRVLADPPGPKVECGGATMHAMETLRREYGGRLDTLRVMFIHAGGFSKRLVHHAVLGKLFSVLPWGERGLTMLEMKLIMYLPYVSVLPTGGVFITGCDDLQLAWLPSQLPDDLFSGEVEGFVALSHPAKISTAVNHGVYVLPGEKRGGQYLYTSPCEEVLQKPSEQLIRERNAVFLQDGEETVQIDGAYWISPATQRSLESLYGQLKPLTEELSGWRDFLQCCGHRRPSHYESAVVPLLAANSARRRTFDALRGAPLLALVVPRSRFYHLGTVREYMEHLCGGGALAAALRLRRRCRALGPPQPGVLLSAVLSDDARVPADAMVEFCRLDGAVELGAGALLSHCHVVGPAHVPPGVLLHTAAVSWQGRRLHVALALGVRDAVKEPPARLRGEPVLGTQGALWSTRLFEPADSMAEAAASTLRRLSERTLRVESHLWSMEDVIRHWDPLAMIDFRDDVNAQVDTAAAGGADRQQGAGGDL